MWEQVARTGSRCKRGAGRRHGGCPERVLFSSGPFGIDLCNGPFSMFRTWHRRNSAVIELTSTRLCALPNRRFGLLTTPATRYPRGVRLPFEIPYASMVSVELQKHPSPIALMEVLDIKYLEGDILQERCIASYRKNIRYACQVIAAARQGMS